MKEYTSITGSKYYYKDVVKDILHREDGPAIEWSDGDKDWYLNGRLHRVGGPAIEREGDSDAWYINGKFIFKIDKSGNIIDRME